MADDLRVIPLEEAAEELGGRTRVIFNVPKKAFSGFIDFVREKGVMGLAIGFVLGSSVQKVVTAFVTDIVNPFIGLFLGRADGFKTFAVGQFMVGDFVSTLIDFLILAFIIYFVFKALQLEKLDKPKV